VQKNPSLAALDTLAAAALLSQEIHDAFGNDDGKKVKWMEAPNQRLQGQTPTVMVRTSRYSEVHHALRVQKETGRL